MKNTYAVIRNGCFAGSVKADTTTTAHKLANTKYPNYDSVILEKRGGRLHGKGNRQIS